MVDRSKIKITVLKRFSPSEVFETSPVATAKPLEVCEVYSDNQSFIVTPNEDPGEDLKMPEGFCTFAWSSIFANVKLLSFGGNLPWFKEKGVAVNCCIDALRPVVFKLERI